MKHKYYYLLLVLVAMLGACGEAKFKIDGEIYGAEGRNIVLEKSDFAGVWIPVDSAKINNTGSFSISSPSPVSPEIYRLELDGRYVYLPIDSIESLRIETSLQDFGRKFNLSGSPQAEQMANFDMDLMQINDTDSATMARFKRDVYTRYIQEGKGSILSYYVLTKVHNGKPLYNPEDKEDAKYYAAVATQFDNYRPDDPHGCMVKEASIQAMRNRNSALGRKTMIKANEIAMLDIELPDASGKNVKLSDVVGRGKPVVLIFSMMNESESPSFNRELAQIYNSKNGAVQFYQISFDTDHYAWRDAAANLPWINVIDPAGMSSNALIDYNVGSLPAVFLYDSAGELSARPESLEDLKKQL